MSFVKLNNSYSSFRRRRTATGQILLEIEFEKIKDNQWCDLELKKSQPIGIYYVEMTSESKLPWGAWGSKQDVYADGVAWKDDQPIKKQTSG